MKRSGFKGLFAAGLLATSLASSTTVVASSDMFLKLGDIKGESTDAKHKDWIEVLSWSWGTATGTGKIAKGNVARQCIQDLMLTKVVDSSTPQLIMNGVTGQSEKQATLAVRKAGGDQQEYLIIKMNDVLISSYQTGGQSGDEGPLVDTVVLHFSSISGEYRPQTKDGSLGNPVVFNIASNCSQ